MKPERIQAASIPENYDLPSWNQQRVIARRFQKDSYDGAMSLVTALFDIVESHDVEPTILLHHSEVELRLVVDELPPGIVAQFTAAVDELVPRQA